MASHQSSADPDSPSSDGFAQPLGDADDAPPPPPPPRGGPEIVEPDSTSGAAGTAAILTKVCDIGVTLRWSEPLSASESAALQHDLAAVLVKYEVPDVPYSEEMQLACNIGGILYRRVVLQAAKEQVAAEQEGSVPHDRHRSGEEGQRQERPAPEAGIPRYSPEARDVLS